MTKHQMITAVIVDDHTSLSFVEVCQHYDITEEALIELIEYGLFSENQTTIKSIQFDAAKLARIQAATRLRQDLDINTPGVILALELLDQIEQLQQEINILQRLSE